MTSPNLMVLLAVACFAPIGIGLVLLRAVTRQKLLERRFVMVRQGDTAPQQTPEDQTLPVRLLVNLGALLSRSGFLPAATITELEQTLASAGLRGRNSLGLFIGGKLTALLLLPLVVLALLHGSDTSQTMWFMYLGGAAVAGLLLPDFIVRKRRAAYLVAVDRGLPDALDMLTICSEAGLSLELGLERVASEIDPAHPAVAAELKLTSGELRILADRRLALSNMGTRTGLETMRRLGGTLIQTLQYGTPLSQALRTLSAEMRYEMLMKFEAQAARLPVLLTLPMVLFILPCIFIVVGGPAGLTVMRTFVNH